MFFGNGLSKPFLRALATHAPLDKRIRTIADPLDCAILPFVAMTES